MWADTSLPLAERVEDLLGRMTLEEKLAQLYSAWVRPSQGVAPMQHEMSGNSLEWTEAVRHGLGQITRPFGTAPIEPAEGVRWLRKLQADVIAASRFGIPAMAHEECLTGFCTWRATVYPTPLAWGATFDPALVEEMAGAIGASMRAVGVHQGLAPVLDVCRDARWGRTEETIGEDPFLVGTIGSAYVRGVQSAGVVATGKHFVGYSASRAGRNFGPVGVGPRELADVLLPPFEMALRTAGLRSLMHAYTEIDGIPTAADETLLTDLVRGVWGFDGVVVADYFGVSFLELLHGVAGSPAEAAHLALAAGVDVELPGMNCYGEPLLAAVRAGSVPESLVDRAARRVLRQKAELGLLDGELPPGDEEVDLDPPHARELARRVAQESVVLLANDGTLPLGRGGRVAVVGPRADDLTAMLGCYTFTRHVGLHHPDLPTGVEIPTLLEALRAELPEAVVDYARGADVDSPDESGFAEAVAVASVADVVVVALGDIAGLFGRGTSGEGCDVTELRLPGKQEQLLEAVLDTGRPVVLVLLSGRPYALGRFADRLAAVVQAFFPGQWGGHAIARVLSGHSNPAGRLPVSVPRVPGGQPNTYLTARLGRLSELSTVDPTPLYPFGHGLSYTSFDYEQAWASGEVSSTDGSVEVSVRVRNAGARAGGEVVQLYLGDPVASVTRPVQRLVGYQKVFLNPGEAATVSVTLHADLSSFTGRDGRRIVEPGELELRWAASSGDVRHTLRWRLEGPVRQVGHDRVLLPEIRSS